MIKRNELKAYFGGIVASHPDDVARQNDMFFINKTEKGNKVSGSKDEKNDMEGNIEEKKTARILTPGKSLRFQKT